jgi:hypothetical protein
MIGWHYSSTCYLGDNESDRSDAMQKLAAGEDVDVPSWSEISRKAQIAWDHFHNVGPPPLPLTQGTLGVQSRGWRAVSFLMPDGLRR